MDSSDIDHRARVRLGASIRKRRRVLELSQDDVRQRGGPSKATQWSWERGNMPPGASRKTMRAYAEALEWKPDHIINMIEGGHESDDPPPPEEPGSDVTWEVDQHLLREMFGHIRTLQEQVKDSSPVARRRAMGIVDELTRIQADILMQAITRQSSKNI